MIGGGGSDDVAIEDPVCSEVEVGVEVTVENATGASEGWMEALETPGAKTTRAATTTMWLAAKARMNNICSPVLRASTTRESSSTSTNDDERREGFVNGVGWRGRRSHDSRRRPVFKRSEVGRIKRRWMEAGQI